MLDAYIIDDIRRREERQDTGRDFLRIDLPREDMQPAPGDDEPQDEPGGIIIIPLSPDIRDEADDAA